MGMWDMGRVVEVTVDDRGRILIPKEVRERLGLKPGSNAKMEAREGKLIITPPLPPEEFIRRMEGCITEGEPAMDPLKLKEMWEEPQDG